MDLLGAEAWMGGDPKMLLPLSLAAGVGVMLL